VRSDEPGAPGDQYPLHRSPPRFAEEDVQHVRVIMLARLGDGYSVVGSQQGVEGLVRLLILAGEDLVQFLDDRRKVLLDGVPEDREIYAEILVN